LLTLLEYISDARSRERKKKSPWHTSSYLQIGICFDVEQTLEQGWLSADCESHPASVGCPVGMKTASSGLERVDVYHHSLSTPASHCVHGNTGHDGLSSQG